MNTRQLATGTLVGGITLFVLGYLIFDLTFAGFYAANAGSATGVDRETQLVWAVALGTLAYAALITYAIVNRPGPLTTAAGATIGAAIAFLLWFTVDFTLYGITNISNLARTIIDPLLELVRGGIAGAVIAAVLRKAPAIAR